MSILYLISGFVLLLLGGDALVNSAVSIAKRLKVSALIIGIVLVGFGTSLPELFTSLQANIKGVPGIAIGNVIGSNIANILLVAGAGALLMPMTLSTRDSLRDGGVLILATAGFAYSAITGIITAEMGYIFMLSILGYIGYVLWPSRKSKQPVEIEIDTQDDHNSTLHMLIFYTFAGIALTVIGADYLVRGASDIARNFGISETIIGLTIVAIGTSLPELMTAIIAGLKGEADLSLGNILGSNIYNILAILGVTAIVKPLPIAASILQFDLWGYDCSHAIYRRHTLYHKDYESLDGINFAW